MHVSVVEYSIRDIDDVGWADACHELEPAFAAVPGLMLKFWLRGEEDTRGGVYIWSDRVAHLAFLDSDLGRALGNHPNIANLTMRDYAVDEALTQVMRRIYVAVG
jgi:Putative mono-oxygenase ydhR